MWDLMLCRRCCIVGIRHDARGLMNNRSWFYVLMGGRGRIVS